MKKNIITLLSAFGMSISGTALAQPREYFSNDLYGADDEMPNALVEEYYGALTGMSFGEWFNGPYATADWFGGRTRLEECGIVPVVTYLGNFAGNVSGGFSRGAAVSSSVQFGAGIDLYKATKIESLENWSLVNAWVWRFGDSLSRRRVGNAFSVQQNFGSQTLNLQSLYLSYSAPIMDGYASLMLKFGRIAAGDNFMTKPIYWLYMSNAIDGNPIGVYLQTRFSAYPGSAWGAMFEIENRHGLYFKSGVYQINSREQDLRRGFDFSMTKALGVNVNAEAGWNINHDGSGRSPGNVSVGFVADWYRARHLDDPSKYSHFNQTAYFQADYMVLNLGFPDRSDPAAIKRADARETYRDLRGIVLWGAVQYDPSEHLAIMPFFANGGAFFNAPFPSRPDDVLCFGVAYGKYSKNLPQPRKSSYEMVFEVNYKVQANRFFFVQPSVQYVHNNKGGELPDAFVFGAQFGASF